MKKILFAFLGLVAVVSLAGCSKTNSLGQMYVTSFGTLTATTSLTSQQLILPANEARTYAVITNDSDTAIYLNLSPETASSTNTNFAIRLNANGGTYVIDETNLYVGNIYASSSVAGKNILILEK